MRKNYMSMYLLGLYIYIWLRMLIAVMWRGSTSSLVHENHSDSHSRCHHRNYSSLWWTHHEKQLEQHQYTRIQMRNVRVVTFFGKLSLNKANSWLFVQHTYSYSYTRSNKLKTYVHVDFIRNVQKKVERKKNANSFLFV